MGFLVQPFFGSCIARALVHQAALYHNTTQIIHIILTWWLGYDLGSNYLQCLVSQLGGRKNGVKIPTLCFSYFQFVRQVASWRSHHVEGFLFSSCCGAHVVCLNHLAGTMLDAYCASLHFLTLRLLSLCYHIKPTHFYSSQRTNYCSPIDTMFKQHIQPQTCNSIKQHIQNYEMGLILYEFD